ncbi:MAG: NifB/NifX family molybdenum-iron cluster-binding protein [Promethearchaeota archaeon]
MDIIAVPSYREGGLNETFHPKFGRCDSFTFITVDNNEIIQVKVIKNFAADEPGGAGTQSAKLIKSNGGNKLIVSRLGSNASKILSSLNIKTFQGPDQEITIKELINLYIDGKLNMTKSAKLIKNAEMGQK